MHIFRGRLLYILLMGNNFPLIPLWDDLTTSIPIFQIGVVHRLCWEQLKSGGPGLSATRKAEVFTTGLYSQGKMGASSVECHQTCRSYIGQKYDLSVHFSFIENRMASRQELVFGVSSPGSCLAMPFSSSVS